MLSSRDALGDVGRDPREAGSRLGLGARLEMGMALSGTYQQGMQPASCVAVQKRDQLQEQSDPGGMDQAEFDAKEEEIPHHLWGFPRLRHGALLHEGC
jgi:hypothetical protein